MDQHSEPALDTTLSTMAENEAQIRAEARVDLPSAEDETGAGSKAKSKEELIKALRGMR